MGHHQHKTCIRLDLFGNTVFCKINSVKCLGEWITPDISKDLAMNSRCSKLERAFHFCKSIDRSKSLFINVKLKYNNSVLISPALHTQHA